VNGNETSDVQIIRFGIREVTSELNEKGYRVFRVNGKKILIRGGGWAEDLLLRRSRDRLEAQLDYVRDLNLNPSASKARSRATISTTLPMKKAFS